MAEHWTSAQAQIRSIAKAVAAAFASSTLSAEEVSPGKIEITDLPWSAPPLITSATLGDASVQDFFDTALHIDGDRLPDFLRQTLHNMWHEPSRVLRAGAYANCATYMPRLRFGQRVFRFSNPIGFPSQLDITAGATLALEVAHAALISVPVAEHVSDDDNYYVRLASGAVLGIVNGLPSAPSPWAENVSGQVQDLLEMTRGETRYECAFDQIASLRSVIHVHQARLPKTFTGLDQALQALRYLSLGTYCPDLVAAIQIAPMDLVRWKEKERALHDAIEVMQHSMGDRSKLQTLRGLLVPGVLTATAFSRNIFSSTNYPFTMAPGKAGQILDFLRNYYMTEVPAGLRQEI